MALIFLGVLFVFATSNFEFHQVQLPFDFNSLDYPGCGQCWSAEVLSQAASETKNLV